MGPFLAPVRDRMGVGGGGVAGEGGREVKI